LALCLALLYTRLFSREDTVFRHAGDVLAAVFYVPNWRFVITGQSYDVLFSAASPVQHFWSLGIEEQFYLLFPLMMAAWLARGSRKGLALAIGLLIAASTIAMGLSHEDGAPLGHAYYGTDTRAAEVLVGVLLAFWIGPGGDPLGRSRLDRILQFAGLMALAISVALWYTTSQQDLWFYRGGSLAYAMTTALVIAAGVRSGPVRGLLSLAPLPHIGRISYGLYVYHWPIYLLLDRLEPLPSTLSLSLQKLLATLLIATASSYLIESPIRYRRHFTGPRRWMIPIAAIGGVSLVAMSTMFLYVNVQSSISEDLPDPQGFTQQSAAGGHIKLALFGNSIIRNLAPAFREWGVSRNLIVLDRTTIGCGMVKDGEAFSKRKKKKTQCQRWMKLWARNVRKIDPDVVVLLSGGMDLTSHYFPGHAEPLEPGDPIYDDWLVEQLLDANDIFSAGGAKVVWLTTPCVNRDAVWIHSKTDGFSAERTAHFNASILPRVAAARPSITSIVDFFAVACPDGSFTQELGGTKQARADGIHFWEPEARWVVERIAPMVLEAAEPRPIQD
jgi:peptidoglycan/LPS O-acetylase OafA/YrhL